MYVIFSKLKEVLFSVLPVTLLVLILHFTLTPLDTPLVIRFLIGAALVILGLTVFLLGVEVGLTPIGNVMGSTAAKSNKLWIVAAAGLIIGFAISIAEPDLHILAGQVDAVTAGAIPKLSLVAVVSVGIALMLSIGLFRIVYNLSLKIMLAVIYGLILIVALFTSSGFLAISFDASGATTGALTVPFILAVATGVSGLKKDSKAAEESNFGLIAVTSTGAILSVMLMSLLADPGNLTGSLETEAASATISQHFLGALLENLTDACVALLPIVVIFLIFQFISFRLPGRDIRKILFGTLFAYVGLVLFLTGVNAGFMDVGAAVGYGVAFLNNKALTIILGFILGAGTILAEPAVHVLTHEIEDVTSGYVSRTLVLLTLSLGVGVAVALSMVRILIPDLKLWQYLLPGYAIALALMYFVPDLFVGIAFDSGGVASGPMAATFILAYTQGAAQAVAGADVLVDGFGMIAMIAMTPLIALQVLGLIYKIKSKKEANK